MHVAIAGLVFGALLGACKSREPTPSVPSHAPASAPAPLEPRTQPAGQPALHLPPEHTFELADDAPIDPAEEQRALRHDCCDEMPASEVEATVQADEKSKATAPTPTPRKRKTPAAHPSPAAVERH